MDHNKIIIYLTIIAIIVVITIPTLIKVQANYKEKMYASTISTIETAATKCVNDGLCMEDEITLKELYDNKYLDRVVNPTNKEYFKDSSYLIKIEDEFEFVEEWLFWITFFIYS